MTLGATGATSPARPDGLRLLRAFAQVARLGSVSRAAEVLGISQPAVTLQLQALSLEHGVVLLERSGRRLVPTEAGEALLALARPLVDGIDHLGAALQARLQAQSPDALAVAGGSVALRLTHAGGASALDALRDGSAGIAVGSWLDVPGDIEFVPMLQSRACLLLPGSHPLAKVAHPAVADLRGHGLVLPAGRHTTRQLVDLAFGRADLPLLLAREAGDWASVMALVALGQGITVSTRLAATPLEDPRIVVRPLPDVFPARPYGYAMRRGRTPGAAAREFIEALGASVDAIPMSD